MTRGKRLTSKQFVPRDLFPLRTSREIPPGRTHNLLVDPQMCRVANLFRAFLTPNDFIVEEAFEVEDQDWGEFVEGELFRRVLCDCTSRCRVVG